jgi:hypothetical protein
MNRFPGWGRINYQNAFIKITLQVFYLMYKFGKKYAMVTGGISMTQLIAMAADVSYQFMINIISKICMLTIIDITTPSDLLSLMEIENNEEKMLFKNRKSTFLDPYDNARTK